MKAIYNITTGQILAYCYPEQDLNRLMSNYSNSDYIEIEYIPPMKEFGKWSIDIATKKLINNLS